MESKFDNIILKLFFKNIELILDKDDIEFLFIGLVFYSKWLKLRN